MNIFVLDLDPIKCSKYLCDIHLNKMVTEHTQMLANCFKPETLKHATKTQKGTERKYSYYNHPCSVWLRKDIANFKWLCRYTLAMLDERMFRGFKDHFCEEFVKMCSLQKPDNLEGYSDEITDFALAMPEQYKEKDIVNSYRSYYIMEKQRDKRGKWMLYYSHRELPEWFPKELKERCENESLLRNKKTKS
jgi:hypothetical protein